MPKSLLLCDVTADDWASPEMLELLYDATASSIVQLGNIKLGSIETSRFKPDSWAKFSEILSLLSSNNRLVSCLDIAQGACGIADNCACNFEIDMADYILHGARRLIPPRAIAIKSYTTSVSRDDIRRHDESLSSDISKADFETKILSKLSRCASSMTIVDKALGRYWNSNAGYKRTLSWLSGYLLRCGITDITLVTSATGFEEVDIHAWCDANRVVLSNRLGDGLPHWRALVSNRFVINIDRGFDLLRPDGFVRRTQMHVRAIPNASATEYRFARMMKPNPRCKLC